MSDYSHIGLTANKMPLNSPYVNRRDKVQGMDFDSQYEVQTNKVRSSKSNIKDIVFLSDVATATGSFTTGQSVTVETSLSPVPPFLDATNLANPFVAVYEGTVAQSAFQIFPSIGGSIATGDYSAYAGFDYHEFDGTNSVYKIYLENVAAGAVDLLVKTQWKYVSNNSGTSTGA